MKTTGPTRREGEDPAEPVSTVETIQLPRGWIVAGLEDLVGAGFVTDGDWVETEDQDPSGEVRLTQLADVGDGRFRDRSSRYLTRERAEQLRCTFLAPGDLLVARMPDPLGRCCILPDLSRPCVTAVDVCIVRLGNEVIDGRWLMHAINSPGFRRAVASLQSGSTRKRISKRNLLTLQLGVPPAREQSRIADTVDTQLTRLDAAVAALERVQANLKRYRASILKAAVEGRLVPTEAELARREGRDYEPASVLLQRIIAERCRRWEEAELAAMKARGKLPKDSKWKDRYEEAVAPDAAKLPPLPEGWCWASVAQLGDVITGNTPPTSRPECFGGELPFFKPTDLDAGYNLRNARDHLTKEGAEVSRVLPSLSILVTCIGATIGKTALARVVGATNQQINALVPLPDFCDPRFLFWTLISPEGYRSIVENASSTTLPILNKSRFSALPVGLPPRAEQQRIVEEIERRQSIEANAADAGELSLQRIGRLRQSILKRAFEGKLVDQDPNDEPASVLLDRIRAEQTESTNSRKVRRKAAGESTPAKPVSTMKRARTC